MGVGRKNKLFATLWGRIVIFGVVAVFASACATGTQTLTVTAQFVNATDSLGLFSLPQKNQTDDQCQVFCETIVFDGEENGLLQLPTTHFLPCDSEGLPLSGSEITLIDGATIKNNNEALSAQVCCEPANASNILDQTGLLNLFGFCGETIFTPSGCGGACDLGMTLSQLSAGELAEAGCLIITGAIVGIIPFVGANPEENFSCDIIDFLDTASELAQCEELPQALEQLCSGVPSGGDEPVCGDGTCDEPGENNNTCPDDCL